MPPRSMPPDVAGDPSLGACPRAPSKSAPGGRYRRPRRERQLLSEQVTTPAVRRQPQPAWVEAPPSRRARCSRPYLPTRGPAPHSTADRAHYPRLQLGYVAVTCYPIFVEGAAEDGREVLPYTHVLNFGSFRRFATEWPPIRRPYSTDRAARADRAHGSGGGGGGISCRTLRGEPADGDEMAALRPLFVCP